MRRREFVVGIGVAAWPHITHAQQAMPLIGYLDSSGLPHWYQAFKQGLEDLGFVQHQTIDIEMRSAAGQAERIPALADELIKLQPKDKAVRRKFANSSPECANRLGRA